MAEIARARNGAANVLKIEGAVKCQGGCGRLLTADDADAMITYNIETSRILRAHCDDCRLIAWACREALDEVRDISALLTELREHPKRAAIVAAWRLGADNRVLIELWKQK